MRSLLLTCAVAVVWVLLVAVIAVGCGDNAIIPVPVYEASTPDASAVQSLPEASADGPADAHEEASADSGVPSDGTAPSDAEITDANADSSKLDAQADAHD